MENLKILTGNIQNHKKFRRIFESKIESFFKKKTFKKNKVFRPENLKSWIILKRMREEEKIETSVGETWEMCVDLVDAFAS